MLAVIIKNPKRRASFLIFLRGKFSELLLSKLSLNADNNAGAYYEDQGTGSFRVAVSYSTEAPLRLPSRFKISCGFTDSYHVHSRGLVYKGGVTMTTARTKPGIISKSFRVSFASPFPRESWRVSPLIDEEKREK